MNSVTVSMRPGDRSSTRDPVTQAMTMPSAFAISTESGGTTYEAANAWYKKNVKAGIPVPKPPLPEAIRLLRAAGGTTALAHPGYYEKAGVDMAAKLPALAAVGLQGLELDYPYHACSPHLFSAEDERTFVARMRAAAEPLGLQLTRGSDCHTRADFENVYGLR